MPRWIRSPMSCALSASTAPPLRGGQAHEAGGGSAGRAAHAARVPEAEHLISFHISVEGQCWGGLNGEA